MLPSSWSLARENTSATTLTRRIPLTLVRLAVGIGLVAYLIESGIIDLRTLSRLFTTWPVTCAAIAILLLDIALMALRLWWLFRPHAFQLSLDAAFRLTMISLFFSSFMPGGTGGDIVKLFYAAKDNKGQRTEIASIMLFDRAIGMFSLLMLPLLIAPFFFRFARSNSIFRGLLACTALLALAMLAGMLVSLSNFAANSRVVFRLFQVLPGGSYARRIMETLRAYRKGVAALIVAFGIALLANLAAIGSTMLVALALNPEGIAWRMSLMIPLGQVANCLPLTPGGLGVGEAAFNALFSLAALSEGAAILLGWRLLKALVSLLGLFYYLRGLRRSIFSLDVPSRETNALSG
jgi:glycosyltransferase 2 family protein